MKRTALFVLAIFLLNSCKKETIKEASWELSNCFVSEALHTNYKEYHSVLQQCGLVKITTKEELEDFANYAVDIKVGDVKLLSSVVGQIDLKEYVIYALSVNYEGHSCGKMRKGKVRLYNSENEVSFDLKLNVNVGGHGMKEWSNLAFVIVPREYTNHPLSGTLVIDENDLFGTGTESIKRVYK